MTSDPGTYLLLLRCEQASRLQVGRWGELDLRPGYYCYTGSAFGPGGVRARVQRHWREVKAKHWHIDYLRQATAPVGVWYAHGTRDLEHRWALRLHSTPDMMPIPAFGNSDCKCESHLFAMTNMPDIVGISRRLAGRVRYWSVTGEGVSGCTD